MSKLPVIYATVLCICILIVALAKTTVAESILDKVPGLMKEIEYLSSKGVDVQSIVDELNNAIQCYQQGDLDCATMHYEKAVVYIEDLKKTADQVYMWNTLSKVLTITILALIPVLVYVGLPRLYLYLSLIHI